jgi:hypothetical protein
MNHHSIFLQEKYFHAWNLAVFTNMKHHSIFLQEKYFHSWNMANIFFIRGREREKEPLSGAGRECKEYSL